MKSGEWISLGISHHTAPLELRERFAITPSKLHSLQHHLPALLGPDEGLLILSTCNRVEWFASLSEQAGMWRIIRSIYQQANIPPPGLLWKREGWDVLRHLARIVAGLDSLLVGESEIAGQVRSAYKLSRQWGIARGGINRLVQQAISLGRRARAESGLDRGRVSLMSLAAQICREMSNWQSGGQALVLGSGEAGRRVIIELLREQAKKIYWTSQHACGGHFSPDLAKKISIKKTESISQLLKSVDCLVACSAAQVLDWSTSLQSSLDLREIPLVVVDLGVPRNTPREMERHPKVLLFNVDGLSGRAALHRESRYKAASIAEHIIASAVAEMERKFSLASLSLSSEFP
jgi:glutamyl-tRNA reductase